MDECAALGAEVRSEDAVAELFEKDVWRVFGYRVELLDSFRDACANVAVFEKVDVLYEVFDHGYLGIKVVLKKIL